MVGAAVCVRARVCVCVCVTVSIYTYVGECGECGRMCVNSLCGQHWDDSDFNPGFFTEENKRIARSETKAAGVKLSNTK